MAYEDLNGLYRVLQGLERSLRAFLALQWLIRPLTGFIRPLRAVRPLRAS